ncbi:hypothetical protein [Amycolatopsis nivea]|uniref:hypothetical protein n=1 Tax=Amycolatopsis nivea TaxID=1644109 RepID=UPI00106F290B|nr:hypothetical protein [Amycolatopsis nivea]
MLKSHQFRLAIRPVGEPRDGDFELAEAELPPLGPGQVLLRTIYLSLDPYMRSRMKNVKSYAAPWEIGEVLPGGTALLLGFVMQLGATGNLVGVYLGSVLQEVGVTDGDRFRRRDCFAQRGSDRRRSFRGSRADGIRRPFEPDLEYVCPLASAISFPVR